MAKKPMYSRILASRAFQTRAEAEDFGKDIKQEYKSAEMSVRFDITRNSSSEWVATLYAKV